MQFEGVVIGIGKGVGGSLAVVIPRRNTAQKAVVERAGLVKGCRVAVDIVCLAPPQAPSVPAVELAVELTNA